VSEPSDLVDEVLAERADAAGVAHTQKASAAERTAARRSASTSKKRRSRAGGVEGPRAASPPLRNRVQTETENGITGQEVGLTALEKSEAVAPAHPVAASGCTYDAIRGSKCPACGKVHPLDRGPGLEFRDKHSERHFKPDPKKGVRK
jgi:hypothetical protein